MFREEFHSFLCSSRSKKPKDSHTCLCLWGPAPINCIAQSLLPHAELLSLPNTWAPSHHCSSSSPEKYSWIQGTKSFLSWHFFFLLPLIFATSLRPGCEIRRLHWKVKHNRRICCLSWHLLHRHHAVSSQPTTAALLHHRQHQHHNH